MLEIYTDGSCHYNPGPGGFGMVVIDQINKQVYYAHNEDSEETTNNREQLKAIICAMQYIKQHPGEYIIYTDSAYAEKSINSWIYNWANNDWKNSKKQTIQNLDLFKLIYSYLNENLSFKVRKIAGHSGIIGNELADATATKNTTKFKKIFQENGLKYAPQ